MEELDDKPHITASYHQLGMIAQDRGLLDDAEAWYRKALAINDDLDNKPGMALSFGQLGLLAENRGQQQQALEWTIRSVVLFGDFPHPATGPAPSHLARLTTKLGTGALEECWQQITGGLLPPAIRSYIEHPEYGGGVKEHPMTDDPVAAAARAAAGRLTTRHSPALVEEVESALHTRGSEHQPDQYFDPVSLGSLIVSIASLAWSIYIGLKQKTPNPAPDVLARAIRVELRTRGNATASQNEVTDVVVTEIIRAVGDQN